MKIRSKHTVSLGEKAQSPSKAWKTLHTLGLRTSDSFPMTPPPAHSVPGTLLSAPSINHEYSSRLLPKARPSALNTCLLSFHFLQVFDSNRLILTTIYKTMHLSSPTHPTTLHSFNSILIHSKFLPSTMIYNVFTHLVTSIFTHKYEIHEGRMFDFGFVHCC